MRRSQGLHSAMDRCGKRSPYFIAFRGRVNGEAVNLSSNSIAGGQLMELVVTMAKKRGIAQKDNHIGRRKAESALDQSA